MSFTEARATMDKLFLKKCPERCIEDLKPIETDLVQPGNWKPDSPGEYYRSPSALKELLRSSRFFFVRIVVAHSLSLSLSLSDYVGD